MSIHANNNHFIHELMINNPQTCSILHSPWAGNARNWDGKDSVLLKVSSLYEGWILRLWPFFTTSPLLMRASETRNSLNACYQLIFQCCKLWCKLSSTERPYQIMWPLTVADTLSKEPQMHFSIDISFMCNSHRIEFWWLQTWYCLSFYSYISLYLCSNIS